MYLKVLARVLIAVFIGGPILCLYFVSGITNLYLLMVVKTVIPMTIAPMLIFGFADEANLGLKLYDQASDLPLESTPGECLLAEYK